MATSRGLPAFSRRIDTISKQVEPSMNVRVQRAALAVDQATVLGTPVNTGRARSNWLVSLGAPVLRVILPHAPGFRLGIGETGNASIAIAQGTAVIGSRSPGVDVYISNSVGYIGLLNAGSSAQAPAMFVETAILAGLAAAAEVPILR